MTTARVSLPVTTLSWEEQGASDAPPVNLASTNNAISGFKLKYTSKYKPAVNGHDSPRPEVIQTLPFCTDPSVSFPRRNSSYVEHQRTLNDINRTKALLCDDVINVRGKRTKSAPVTRSAPQLAYLGHVEANTPKPRAASAAGTKSADSVYQHQRFQNGNVLVEYRKMRKGKFQTNGSSYDSNNMPAQSYPKSYPKMMEYVKQLRHKNTSSMQNGGQFRQNGLVIYGSKTLDPTPKMAWGNEKATRGKRRQPVPMNTWHRKAGAPTPAPSEKNSDSDEEENKDEQEDLGRTRIQIHTSRASSAVANPVIPEQDEDGVAYSDTYDHSTGELLKYYIQLEHEERRVLTPMGRHISCLSSRRGTPSSMAKPNTTPETKSTSASSVKTKPVTPGGKIYRGSASRHTPGPGETPDFHQHTTLDTLVSYVPIHKPVSLYQRSYDESSSPRPADAKDSSTHNGHTPSATAISYGRGYRRTNRQPHSFALEQLKIVGTKPMSISSHTSRT